MHDRAHEYRRCAKLTLENHERDGGAALFDTALNNALVAIVAHRWPGDEFERRGLVRAARGLLTIIEERGRASSPGVVELPDLDSPPEGAEFMGPLLPKPAVVQFDTLRNAIKIAEVPRHARPQDRRPLQPAHIEALAALNDDAALRVSFAEDVDEIEERVTIADAEERRRARAYFEMLSLDEQERREECDYVEQYTEVEDDVRTEPEDCPVCGLQALVAAGFDSYVGEFAWGTCAACSYSKAFEVADFEGRDEAIDRAANDPNR